MTELNHQHKLHIYKLTGYSYDDIMKMSDPDFYLFKIVPLLDKPLTYIQLNFLIKQRHELNKGN